MDSASTKLSNMTFRTGIFENCRKIQLLSNLMKESLQNQYEVYFASQPRHDGLREILLKSKVENAPMEKGKILLEKFLHIVQTKEESNSIQSATLIESDEEDDDGDSVVAFTSRGSDKSKRASVCTSIMENTAIKNSCKAQTVDLTISFQNPDSTSTPVRSTRNKANIRDDVNPDKTFSAVTVNDCSVEKEVDTIEKCSVEEKTQNIEDQKEDEDTIMCLDGEENRDTGDSFTEDKRAKNIGKDLPTAGCSNSNNNLSEVPRHSKTVVIDDDDEDIDDDDDIQICEVIPCKPKNFPNELQVNNSGSVITIEDNNHVDDSDVIVCSVRRKKRKRPLSEADNNSENGPKKKKKKMKKKIETYANPWAKGNTPAPALDYIPLNSNTVSHPVKRTNNQAIKKSKSTKASNKQSSKKGIPPSTMTTSETSKKPEHNYDNNLINPNAESKRSGLRPVIIDANNVAVSHGRGSFSTRGLHLCIKYFTERGHKVIAFVPKYRRYQVPQAERKELDDLEKQGIISYTPSRTMADGRKVQSYDDRFIVQAATELGGIVVSQDNYRDILPECDKWKDTIEHRLLMFTWAGDILMFPNDPLGRGGPHLEDFLRFPESA